VPDTKCVKAELHVHLEGSIEPETLLAIDPRFRLATSPRTNACRTFDEFIQGYIWSIVRSKSPSTTLSQPAICWSGWRRRM